MTADHAPGGAELEGGGVDRRPELEGVDRRPERIEAMFGAIAARYDLMNRLMTAGLDRRWRRAAAGAADLPPAQPALDVCCGTGDLVLALARRYPRSRVTGVDFSEEMLRLARAKAARAGLADSVELVRGDLLELPFPDDSFAAATVAFGVRNVADLSRAFSEMARVTRPGGHVVCLEITSPPGGVGRRFHELWFERLVPALGRFVAEDGSAYSYLPASVRAFPSAEGVSRVMLEAGLSGVRFVRFGFGIIAMHVGHVPGEGSGVVPEKSSGELPGQGSGGAVGAREDG
jgi:demethylmenaquinone methyltransferase / 2-methoxy-6-polyprenyl-1,4-benzoquinol methylase